VRHAHQLALSVAFFHLAVDQARRHLPPAHVAPSTFLFSPCPKMGRERIEGEIEPVTGKEGEATGSQELSQGMDDPLCHVLGAGTELKHGKNLGARVESQPEPEHLCSAAEPGTQFVQWEVREVEMAKGPLVQGWCVHGLLGTTRW